LIFIHRYPLRQILSVILITSGIILSTYASSQSLNKQKLANNIKMTEEKPDLFRWFIGIGMLIFALLVSSLMGIYQEKLYATYGKHPDEALFYSVKNFVFKIIFLFIFIFILASSSFTIICNCW
jgi:UDP-xylose/UDP-N-acetylglucosamine transporter B4